MVALPNQPENQSTVKSAHELKGCLPRNRSKSRRGTRTSRPIAIAAATRPAAPSTAQAVTSVLRCSSCERFYFPPSDYCPRCLSADVAWTPVSGRGTVYSWVTMHRAYTPAYDHAL